MATSTPRYWAIRTDRENKEVLLDELRQGRLRQGWGHHPAQDLRLIQEEILRGGAWWERLSQTQKEVLPQLRMLSSSVDSVQVGDRVLVPNLPDDSSFVLTEVVGEYSYNPLSLYGKTDVNKLGQDYGHILSVRLLTEKGINKYSDHVHANIRSTLRTPMRMWNLNGYAELLEQLITDYKSGADFSTPKSGDARLKRAWEIALSHAADVLRGKLELELNARFQAAEWEEPIKTVLENLYPGSDVRWVGGPQEHGADVIVQIPNHFGGLPWLILVQVKNFTGEIGPEVLGQLKVAHDHYSKEGKLLSLIVMTTAHTESNDLPNAATAVSEQLGVPIKIVLGKEMMKILSNGLIAKMDQSIAPSGI